MLYFDMPLRGSVQKVFCLWSAAANVCLCAGRPFVPHGLARESYWSKRLCLCVVWMEGNGNIKRGEGIHTEGGGGKFKSAQDGHANTIKGTFFSLGRWRWAFWVPVGVRGSKCEQHLYRCCVIFIALLHLLGGISLSVNNQVNCTQTRSGTPANFFIVTLTQAIFLSSPSHPSEKKYNTLLLSLST